MFCDMVGSSALSTRIDPEEQRDVISAFQACCANEIKRLGGMVAQYLGDGVLAYFGYPAAHEDDAERAVRSGLAILSGVGRLQLPADVSLQTRIGIASGIVVVGDLVGEGVTQENAAIGETTNLAARLQSLAGPNTVFICPETHRILDRLFTYHELGEQSLKGFADPVFVRQVIGESKVQNRFEARHGDVASPLLGRDEELELLLRRWEQAKRGEGRVVLVSGEAGIGKSRLTRALQDRLAAEPHTRMTYHCSPYHRDSALYPVISHLYRGSGIEHGDPTDAKLDKLEALLRQSSDAPSQDMPLFAALLSIPGGTRYATPKISPQHMKELTLRMLIGHLKRLAVKRPVLMLFEDLHWVDPTTLELLALIVEAAPHVPLLFIATFRPDFVLHWPSEPHISRISLNRLSYKEGRALVEGVANGKSLPTEVLEQILQRADGVPLFIEELTKTVLEAGLLRDDGARYVLTGPLPPLAIPSTLHASLAARLDRLGSAKDVAQIGATLGREFSYRLLSAVSGLQDKPLQDALTQLVEAELIFQRGTAPDAVYQFKHGLVQDAAYAGLVRSRRQQLHAAVGRALEERFSETAQTEPELVAHHYTEARMPALAIRFWQRAGNRALERSANSEAIDHFKRVLTLSREHDAEVSGLEAEFEARHGLGKATFASGHLVDAMSIFAEAMALARKMESPEKVAACALSFDQAQFLTGQNPQESASLLREAMAGLPDREGNLRCQLLSRLGRAHLMTGDEIGAVALYRDAVQLARELKDDRALFDAFTGKFMIATALKETQFGERAAQVDELIEIARQVDDPDYVGRALSVDVYFAAETGDRRRLDRAIQVYKEFSAEKRTLLHQWVVQSGEAMCAILDGDFGKAEALSEKARAIGEATRSESVDGVYGMQMFSIRREQGRLGEVAPVIKRLMDDDLQQSEWRPGFALIAADLGFVDAARRRLAQLAEEGFRIPFDAKRSTSLSYIAEVAVAVQDMVSAKRLYDLMLDYQDMTITSGLVTVCYGSASRYLGMLAAALGEQKKAVEHFEHALAMNAALGARPWLAHTQAEYARLLKARGDPAAVRQAAALTREALTTAADLGMPRLDQRLQTALL